jgi:phosphoglycerate dehydrogenase-like enzyme
MADTRVFISHEALYNHDSAELADEIRTRRPDIELDVAPSYTETVERVGDADVMITLDMDERIMEQARSLAWIQSTASGVDIYDLDPLRGHDVALTNAAGVSANPIAEQVVGSIIAFERRLHEAFDQRERREFRRLEGRELHGKTIGIVGVGAIGSRVAELAQAFDMRVLGTKATPETGHEHVDELRGPDATQWLAGRADYLLVSCPLTDETRNLVGDQEFASMSADTVLVNVARGPIVDQQALRYALQKGRIRGAILDVFEEEPLPPDSGLWSYSNVIITPHMAGSTPRYFERVADLFVTNWDRFLDDGVDGLENRVL